MLGLLKLMPFSSRRLPFVGVIICALIASLAPVFNARAQLPSIDPTGQRIFAWPNTPFRPEPGSMNYRNTTGLAVMPAKIAAPVGTEVVMLAAVCGQAGFMMANERVEWMITPGGVGQFVALGERYPLDWLQGIGGSPKKVDNSLAIGTTSSRYVTLTRGTPTPVDDVQVLKGQAWITVTSPVEGMSYVTAYAPSVYSWDRHKQTAAIYWIDALWTFPPPANAPVGGRRTLTTTMTRRSSGLPLAGWLVRYEATGTPAAGFAPDGAPVVEVMTDLQGQATVELFQPQPAPGANNVTIQVIRPATFGGSYGENIVAGIGGAATSWTTGGNVSAPIEVPQSPAVVREAPIVVPQVPPASPAPVVESPPRQAPVPTAPPSQPAETPVPGLQLTMQGPTKANVGDQVTFTATIKNNGTNPVTDLIVVDRFDAGLAHAEHTSPIEQSIVPLNPGQSRRINVKLRVTKPGELCNVVEIHGPGGTKTSARGCVTATPAAGTGAGGAGTGGPAATGKPAVTIKKVGPPKMSVGQVAEFTIEVTNSGDVPLTQLKVVDHFDGALEPKSATGGHAVEGDDLVWTIASLPPGKSFTQPLRVQCMGLKPSARACNQAIVTTAEGARDTSEACLEIVAAAEAGIAPEKGPASDKGADASSPNSAPRQSAARPPDAPAPQAGPRKDQPLPPGLSVRVADLTQSIAIGKDTLFDIRVSNSSQTPDKQLVLVVSVSPQATPQAVGTSGPAQSTIEGQIVRFAEVAEIRAGETLKYQIRIAGKSAGEARLQVRLTSAAAIAAIVAEGATTIVAE